MQNLGKKHIRAIFWIIVSCIFSNYTIAHPHSFIRLTAKFIIEDNQVVGIQESWELDEMTTSSLFDSDSVLTATDEKAKIASAANEIIENVIQDSFFNNLYQNNKHIKLSLRKGSVAGSMQAYRLTTKFILDLEKPINLLKKNNIVLMIYEPTFYVDMRFDSKKSIFFSDTLPTTCKIDIIEPSDSSSLRSKALAFDAVNHAAADALAMGRILAQKVVLSCEQIP